MCRTLLKRFSFIPMNAPMYVVISPVRNEAAHIGLTIESMISQTIRPACWFIVDDGSEDKTWEIASAAAAKHPWIHVHKRADRGYRKAGGGVVDAFYSGYGHVGHGDWDYLVKLDGDMSFAPDYFEKCFEHFAANERLGIAGGTVMIERDGGTCVESKIDPRFHVRGATKIYRRECWSKIGGIERMPGWDTIDEIKASMLGWQTLTIPEIPIVHHRPTGAAYGSWKDRVKNGLGCYLVGYHPIFMFLKSVRRAVEKPYVVGACGLMFGFVKGYVTRAKRVDDPEMIRYLRKQQINRILLRKSLWQP